MSTIRSWVTLGALAAASAGFSTSVRSQTDTIALLVDDPRPLNAAVWDLMQRYPITVTYEEPRFEFAGDIRDVTDQVRKTANASAGRILIPSGGLLQANYEVSRDTGNLVSVADAIQSIVEAKNANPVGGRFEVYRRGEVLHIVPSEVRDSEGVWIKPQSILSAPVTFASEELDGYQLIEAILKQVSSTTGQDVRGPVVGGGLSNPLVRYHGKVEARGEPAREVLTRVLRSFNPRFTWLLNYDPSARNYMFSVVLTAEPAPPEPPPVATRLPGDPTPAGPPFRPRND